MEKNEKKIKIAIVSGLFFQRLGIKTILNVLGIDPDIYEAEKTIELEKLMSEAHLDFVILNEDMMPKNTEECACLVHKIEAICQVMLIGSFALKDCPNTSYILNSNNKKEVLEKFQDFFFEPKQSERSVEEGSVLSDREVEVLKEVALGFANKEIADKLFISINTVITHRKNITEKLGIKTIAGLTVYAMMNNLIKPDEAMNQ